MWLCVCLEDIRHNKLKLKSENVKSGNQIICEYFPMQTD